ncbi:MAG: RsmD family RNA methyltransferase [Coriobacteriales bacterium]|jgi:16S rRNA (guanine966-N2)-methyltransferase
MRVVAGEFKGRKIDMVPDEGTRPTSEMVREAFASSVLSKRNGGFEGAKVLDAFAGSGAVGIEALSRGAATCTFIDSNQKAIATIESNLGQLPMENSRYKVVHSDSLDSFSTTRDGRGVCIFPGGPFDIVFLDPPYAIEPNRVCSFVRSMGETGGLEDGSLIAYETPCKKFKKLKKKDPIPEDILQMLEILGDGFSLMGVKGYGNTRIVYFGYSK